MRGGVTTRHHVPGWRRLCKHVYSSLPLRRTGDVCHFCHACRTSHQWACAPIQDRRLVPGLYFQEGREVPCKSHSSIKSFTPTLSPSRTLTQQSFYIACACSHACARAHRKNLLKNNAFSLRMLFHLKDLEIVKLWHPRKHPDGFHKFSASRPSSN